MRDGEEEHRNGERRDTQRYSATLQKEKIIGSEDAD